MNCTDKVSLRVKLTLIVILVTGILSTYIFTTTAQQKDAGELVLQLSHANNIKRILFSPDSRFMASAGADGTLKIWEVETGAMLRTISSDANSIAFHPDGQILATAEGGGIIRLWDFKTGKEILSVKGSDSVYSITFSPDGRYIAADSNSYKTGYFVKIWDSQTGVEVKQLQGHTEDIKAVSFGAKGRLASGSRDKTVKIWNVDSGREIFTIDKLPADPTALSFSPDGKILALADENNSIKLYDAENGKLLSSIQASNYIYTLSFSPDGQKIVCGGADGKIYDVKTGKPLPAVWDYVSGLSFSPDGKWLAIAFNAGIQLNDTSTWKLQRTFARFASPVNFVVFSPDDKTLLSGDGWGSVSVWNLERGKLGSQFRVGERNPFSYFLTYGNSYEWLTKLSPDGKTLVVTKQYANEIKLYDALRETQLPQKISIANGHFKGAAFSSDGKKLAVIISGGDADKGDKVSIYDVVTGKVLNSFDVNYRLNSLTFANSDKSIITTDYDKIRIRDAETGKELDSFNSYGITATGSDGRLLAYKNSQAIKIYDTANSKELNAIEFKGKPNAMTFSYGNKYIAATSGREINIWNTETGEKVSTFSGHDANVNSLAFSHDGEVIVSGAADSHIILWSVKSGAKLLDLVAFNEKNWLALSHDNRYDGTVGAMKWMRVVKDSHASELEKFDNESLTPKLISQTLSGTLSSIPKSSVNSSVKTSLVASPPRVKILSPTADALINSEHVEIFVEVSNETEAGETHLSLFLNGSKIPQKGEIAEQNSQEKRSIVKFKTEPVAGVNELRVTGTNSYGQQSETAFVKFEYRIPIAANSRPAVSVQTGHEASVMDIAFNSNGTLLASVDRNQRVVLWDAVSGKQLRAFESRESEVNKAEEYASTAKITFSPDNKSVATLVTLGSDWSDDKKNKISVWDISTGLKIKSFVENDDGLKAVKESEWFKRNPKMRVAGDVEARVSGRSIIVKKSNGESRELSVQGVETSSLDLSSDGKLIAAEGNGFAIRFWDVISGQTFQTLSGHKDVVNIVTFSPNGKVLASGSKDATVKLWDTENRREIATLESHSKASYKVIFVGKDGLYEINSRGVNQWSVATGRLQGKINYRYVEEYFGTLNNKGTVMATASYGSIIIRDAKTGKEIKVFEPTNVRWCNSMSYSLDDKLLVCGSQSTEVITFDAETGKVLHRFVGHTDTVEAAVFSPDSKFVGSAGGSNGETGKKIEFEIDNHTAVDNRIRIWDAATGKQLREMEGHSNGVTSLIWHPKNKELLISAGNDGAIKLWNPIDGKFLQVLGKHSASVIRIALSSDGRTLASTDMSGTIKLWDVEKRTELKTLQGHTLAIGGLDFSADGKKLASASNDSMVKIWDAASGNEIASFISLDEKDYIAITPEGFYTSSKGALKGVAFRFGNRAFSLEQFDLTFNRPDLVARKLGIAEKETLDSFHQAYLKRLKRLGYAEDEIKTLSLQDATNESSPEIIITDANIPVSTQNSKLSFNIKIEDAKSNLESMDVKVNGVSIYGEAGFSLAEKNARKLEKQIDLELSSGRNRIEISAINKNKIVSVKKTFDLLYASPKTAKPDLYVVVVGVSKYVNKNYDLTYAAKDASDLKNYFSNQGARYGNVQFFELLDADATKENIVKAKDFLLKSKVDDYAVVFFSGHGMLDDKLDYYFGTTDVDFKDPAKRGMPYTEIENLMDKIPARHKLLLMDTCHAGEVDKEGLTFTVSDDDNAGASSVKVREIKGSEAIDKPKIKLSSSFELQRELFSDLQKGSGAVVISASGGAEYAFEDKKWKNGVFTYSLLDGLQTGLADADGDGEISVSELRDYVSERVRTLTKDMQKPTVRSESEEFDFSISTRPFLVHNFKHSASVESIAFNSDGSLLASLSKDKSARIWNAASGEQEKVFSVYGDGSVLFSPDNKFLITSALSWINLWDIKTGEEFTPKETSGVQTNNSDSRLSPTSGFALHPNGKIIAGGNINANSLKMWNVLSEKEIHTFALPAQGLTVYNSKEMGFSPNGRLFACLAQTSGNDDKQPEKYFILIWDTNSGRQIRSIIYKESAILSMAFSPDSSILAVSASDDGEDSRINVIRLFDVKTGKLIREITKPVEDGLFNNVAFSRDGKIIASGDYEGNINLWDSANGQEIKKIAAHNSVINSIAFSPDDKYLASAGEDATVRLWKVKD